MKDVNAAIASIYTLFVTGQKADAAKKIRGLSKIGIVRMLTEYYNFNSAALDIVGNRQRRYRFEIFVMQALEGGV